MMKHIFAAVLALAPAPVLAQGPVSTRTVRVQTADLDLASHDGLRTLDRRLKVAIRSVCPGRTATELRELMVHRACANAATRSAAERRRSVLAARPAPMKSDSSLGERPIRVERAESVRAYLS